MRVTLIHNPSAGGDDRPSADRLIGLIRRAGHSVAYQSSAGAGWDRVLREESDVVAVAGGDGIVGQVARRMIGQQVPIAVLPMGTANNIANAVGLMNQSLEELIAGWSRGRHALFDTGSVTGPWGTRSFIEGLGVGLFTDTMCRLDARKNRDIAHLNGSQSKMAAVLDMMRRLLDDSPLHRLNLVVDGQDLSGEYVLVEAMNIRSVGPNLELAPDADPCDALFDIVSVSEDESAQIREYLSNRIAQIPSLPAFTTRRGRALRIECPALRIHVDDDLWPHEHAESSSAVVESKIVPASLRILAPA